MPSMDLLREFHFSTTIQQTYKELMGAVALPRIWEVRFSVNIDPLRRQRILRLTIQVQDHQRLIQFHDDELVEETIPGRIVVTEELVDDYLLYETRAPDRSNFVENSVKSLFFKIKQGLYEFDPRIGHSPIRDGPLLDCPLLDPDEPLSRVGVFVPLLHQPSIVTDDRVIGKYCPLCDGEIEGGKEFFWGGANLLWVHAECWRNA